MPSAEARRGADTLVPSKHLVPWAGSSLGKLHEEREQESHGIIHCPAASGRPTRRGNFVSRLNYMQTSVRPALNARTLGVN
jgi:hypothetical protein